MLQKSDVKVGTLFRYNKRLSIHDDVHGHVGIVLGSNNGKQYKVRVSHKTLYITLWSMEQI